MLKTNKSHMYLAGIFLGGNSFTPASITDDDGEDDEDESQRNDKDEKRHVEHR